NPFVRGGIVEWQQRDYTIEYAGKSLTHSLSHLRSAHPVRLEDDSAFDTDLDWIRALVINVRTENEAMDTFTAGRATIRINGQLEVENVVIAVGKIEEDTNHDVEWLYFDFPVPLTPDMSIELTHRALSDSGDDEPHWRMTFRLRALTRQNTLVPCTL